MKAFTQGKISEVAIAAAGGGCIRILPAEGYSVTVAGKKFTVFIETPATGSITTGASAVLREENVDIGFDSIWSEIVRQAKVGNVKVEVEVDTSTDPLELQRVTFL